MKVIHSIKGFEIAKNIKKKIGFLLTNHLGGYLCFFQKPVSRYQGWFVSLKNGNKDKETKIFKIIENLEIVNSSPVIELKNNFWNIERKQTDISEKFFLPWCKNSFVYELSETALVEVVLDVRESYDNRKWGRDYQVSEENGLLLVKYTKKQEDREEYSVYLAIFTDLLDYSKKEDWILRNYELDKERNSLPSDGHVFSALRIKARKIVFSVSIDKEEAIKEAKEVFKITEELKKIAKKRTKNILSLKKNKYKEIKMAEACAKDALNKMVVLENKKYCFSFLSKAFAHGMFAGLPWFFQFWTRDTAISLKSFFEIDKEKAKQILFKQMSLIDEQGHINGTSDGVGWIFKRVDDFLDKNAFNRREKQVIKEKLKNTIDGLLKYYTEDGFALSLPRQTWMDTLERDGKQIEIQALRLNILKLAYRFFKDKQYLKLEQQLKEKVQEKFWNGKCLADELNDPTIRSNIFLVAYIYPDLLKKREWIACFENVLPKLWCNWGGVTTIDKTSPLFVDEHTGENPQSYHSGDSWFWVNNLTAIVLYNVDKEKFKKYIVKILEASTKEILWQGVVGHHTELSSAKELKSQGCWSQAWSSALYLELIDVLF
ncbi:MAG: hypothetical protein LRZ96_00775 [Candidatus Pacebacteria bacterium]|nr:hypothetical protein [Candidatus Paceibacterota bacterium]